MRRVATTSEMRSNSAWLAGLVATMNAVTRNHGADARLCDRFAAHLKQPNQRPRDWHAPSIAAEMPGRVEVTSAEPAPVVHAKP